MNKWLSVLSFIVLFSISTLVLAESMSHLYDSQVSVTDKSSAALKKGLSDVLSNVFVKVTGRVDVLSLPAVQSALLDANSYVQSYRYEKVQNLAYSKLDLVAKVEKNKVDQLLQQNGIGVWGDNRPTVLLWLAVNDVDAQHLVSEEQASSAANIVKTAAERRALPVILPLLDLQDKASLTYQDVWGQFQGAIVSASERYSPDIIVVGRLFVSGQGWQAKMAILSSGNTLLSWQGHAATQKNVLEEAMDWLSTTLAKQYAVTKVSSPIHQGGVIFDVNHVNTIDDYANLQSYLNKLPGLSGAQLTSVHKAHCVYHVKLDGALEQVLKNIAMDKKIQFQHEDAENSVLYFDWVSGSGL